MLTVYHGTADYSLPLIRAKGLEKKRRSYVRHPCASTTTAFSVAEMFAIRRTPAMEALRGEVSGVVLEFSLHGTETCHYVPARDASTHQEENEIAVFDTKSLRLRAVHRYRDGVWRREAV